MDHPGIAVNAAGNPNVLKIVLGKVAYDAPTDTYVDAEAKIAMLNDGGTLRRWARKCPSAAGAHIQMDSYPTDADPNFRYHYVGPSTSLYDVNYGYTITRVSTGTEVFESSTGVLPSAGGGEQYTFVITAQIVSDYDIPPDFRPYQTVGDVFTSSPDTYTDPRSIA